MSTAREDILDRIRRAQADSAATVSVHEAPAPKTLDTEPMLELFVENLVDYRAVVHQVGAGEIAGKVDEILRNHGCRSVVIPPDLPDDVRPGELDATVDDGLSAYDLDKLDAVVTTSAVGIARTGTIVLDHTDGQARRALSLVPDVHVCVIRADQVVTSVPEATAALRPSVEQGRPLTWISGPSATSDIELNRVEGVHGPRNLEVILVR